MSDDSSARVGLPERRAALVRLERASATFDTADAVHTEARIRLLDRLRLFNISPTSVLDLGSATGKGTTELAALYPQAQIVAIDLSRPMARRTLQRCSDLDSAGPVIGDAEQLPLMENSFDLVFANLLLPWCDPRAVFAEIGRVLRAGGLTLFTTVGPDTLQEVRRAWREVDNDIHVHGFVDMHDLGDLAVRSGLVEPVMDVDRLQVTYRDPGRLVDDLRACGATNVAYGRRTQLTGAARWQAFCERLAAQRVGDELSISVELIFGQAWGTAGVVASGDGAVRISVEDLARKLPGRGTGGR